MAFQMPDLEVWFQRATDVVRKLLYGDVDIGIVGYDMFMEIADADPELIVVHDALGFGACHLGLGIPTTGKFAGISTLDQLRRSVVYLLDYGWSVPWYWGFKVECSQRCKCSCHLAAACP